MAGNVAEWTLDRWDHARYREWVQDLEEDGEEPPPDPAFPLENWEREATVRGGSWRDSACGLLAAGRVGKDRDTRRPHLGFRCAIECLPRGPTAEGPEGEEGKP